RFSSGAVGTSPVRVTAKAWKGYGRVSQGERSPTGSSDRIAVREVDQRGEKEPGPPQCGAGVGVGVAAGTLAASSAFFSAGVGSSFGRGLRGNTAPRTAAS